MKLSIGAFSFNNLRLEGKMNIFSYIETVHERFNLQALDLWNAYFANISRPLWQVADDATLFRIRDALKEREMTVVNLAVDTAHVWDPDPEVREALHQNALTYLRAAELIGAQSVRIDAVQHGDGVLSEEALEYIAARYREYAARGQEGGYWVGPENHTGFSVQPEAIARISTAVDHPSYGVLLHMGRWASKVPSVSRKPQLPTEDEMAAGDEHVARWARHTHIDWRTLEAENAGARLHGLAQQGYDGYWAVEHHAPSGQLEAVEEALRRLRAHGAHAASLSAAL
ncbi:sugar phosphate isomerase/epimerase family protein [Paenibacillus sp. 481]|uniref:sugar phosphate isomerase/epimerase family protein n=1 Tax=Paenibacillus sp. 481 TaxID=2835869 RepID=UPI001E65BE3B|nr:TIM barrel protein [Paenibacillus sp. 481]UHA75593.1 sugar phosphate isomerase/epimerase [Paenibacillus sp. 481]